jgi:hypothetical protein
MNRYAASADMKSLPELSNASSPGLWALIHSRIMGDMPDISAYSPGWLGFQARQAFAYKIGAFWRTIRISKRKVTNHGRLER